MRCDPCRPHRAWVTAGIGEQVADPQVLRLGGGRWKMVYKVGQ